jgi:carbonic anhydrase/acetyltransferase-like protein (isoleucine patch superfamily)/quercetin dioxygenase-like cupin family protein
MSLEAALLPLRKEHANTMNITRLSSAPVYRPPNHFDMTCLRLQGHEAGPSDALWMGLSQLLPGGCTGFDASPVEKHYVVLDGAVTIITEQGEATLQAWDSCRLAPGEARRLENRTNRTASILLAMPYAPASETENAAPRLALENLAPVLDEGVYIAPSAKIIGDVQMARGSSAWFGAIVRGDNDRISIGCQSNIQDNAVLHTDPGTPLVIGDRVSVGHLAMLHGCTVGDDSLIGIGAVVLNGAKIGRHCLIAAKSLVAEGKVIPDYSIVQGVPGRVVGELTDRHKAMMERASQSYVKRAIRYLHSGIR